MFMANAPVVHIGENSPEHVAHTLLHEVANLEKRSFNPDPTSAGWKAADRSWLLDTYAECLTATRGGRYVAAK
jgi:hypothetical protein